MNNKKNQYLVILESLLNVDYEINGDMKYDKLINVLSLALGDEISLYVHNIKKQSYRCCCIKGMDKQLVDEFIKNEASILYTLSHKEDKKYEIFNSRINKELEYAYIPLYYQSYMIGIIVFNKISKYLIEKLSDYEIQIIFTYVSQLIYHIEKVKLYEEKLLKDQVTGLHSLLFLEEHLKLLKKNDILNQHVFIMIKVCSLKAYNKKHGYIQGNDTLNKIASCINSFFQKDSKTYRLLGPHIGILVKDNYIRVYERLVSLLKELNLSSTNWYNGEITYKSALIILDDVKSKEICLDVILELGSESINKLNDSEEMIYINGQIEFKKASNEDTLLELMEKLDLIK